MTMKVLQINLQMSRERPAPQLLVSAAQVKEMTQYRFAWTIISVEPKWILLTQIRIVYV